MNDAAPGAEGSWIAFWTAEVTDAPSHPIYLVLFLTFVIIATCGLYAYRGLPHWVIDGAHARLLRLAAASIAAWASAGMTILIFQVMHVPLVNRRAWLGIVVLAIMAQLSGLALAAWRSLRVARG